MASRSILNGSKNCGMNNWRNMAPVILFWMDTALNSSGLRKKDAMVQFSMEELPHKAEGSLEQAEKTIFTRFIHAIFDPEKEIFTHLDGAMRIYEKFDYEDRTSHCTLKDCNKSYLKVEIFRIDGEIDYETFRHAVGAFYKWNRMPVEYFESHI